jgi:hypothetical protein
MGILGIDRIELTPVNINLILGVRFVVMEWNILATKLQAELSFTLASSLWYFLVNNSLQMCLLVKS